MVGDSTSGRDRRSRLASTGSATPSSARTAPAAMITPVAASGSTTTSTNEMAGHQSRARTGVGTDHSRISDGMRSSYPISPRTMRGGARALRFAVVDHAPDPAAALVDENSRFAALAEADPDTPVPTCPGWSLKQLFRHVGRGDRWAATIVRTGRPVDPKDVADGRPPEGALVEWLHGGATAILDAVREVGPDARV